MGVLWWYAMCIRKFKRKQINKHTNKLEKTKRNSLRGYNDRLFEQTKMQTTRTRCWWNTGKSQAQTHKHTHTLTFGAARHFRYARLFITNKDFVSVWLAYSDANRDYILRGIRIRSIKKLRPLQRHRILFIIRPLDGYWTLVTRYGISPSVRDIFYGFRFFTLSLSSAILNCAHGNNLITVSTTIPCRHRSMLCYTVVPLLNSTILVAFLSRA